MIKKIISFVFIIPLLIGIFFPTTASAQTQGEQSAQPITLELISAEVDATNSSVQIEANLINSTNQFIPELQYAVEFHKGEALNKNGYAFEGMEMVHVANGSVKGFAPQETGSISFSANYPETIISGNYFLRFVVFDNEFNFYDLEVTEEPLALAGDGKSVPLPYAFLENSEGSHFSLDGPTMSKDEIQTVVIPLNLNNELQKRFDEGETFSVTIDIENIAKPGEIVHSYGDQELQVRTLGKTTQLYIDLDPWEGIDSGSYSMIMRLKDSSGDFISGEIYGRWLIEGSLVRIRGVDSGTNKYRAGSETDLEVSIIYADFPDAKDYTLRAIFTNSDGDSVIKDKEIKLQTFDGRDQTYETSFKGQFGEKMKVANVTVQILDGDAVINEYVLDMPTNRSYISGEVAAISAFIIGGLLLVFALIVGLYVYFHRHNNQVVTAGVIVLLAIGAAFVMGNHQAFAQGGGSGGSYGGDPDPLTVACTVGPNPSNTGDTVTWESDVQGTPVGNLTYDWDIQEWGPDGGEIVNTTFNQTGIHTGNLTVTDDGNGAIYTATCDVDIEEPIYNHTNGIEVRHEAANPTGLQADCEDITVGYTIFAWCQSCQNHLKRQFQFKREVNPPNGVEETTGIVEEANMTGSKASPVSGPFFDPIGLSATDNNIDYWGEAHLDADSTGEESACGFPSIVPSTVNNVICEPPVNVSVSCDAVPTTALTNEPVTFTANATGGDGNFSYVWSGAFSRTTTSSTTQQSFSTTGTKNVTITAIDDYGNGTSDSATCPIIVVTNDICPNIDGIQTSIPAPGETYYIGGAKATVPPEGLYIDESGDCVPNFATPKPVAFCSVSPTTVNSGDPVNWSSFADYGTPAYSYSWSGDNGFTSSAQNPPATSYTNTSGGPVTKYATITVTDSAGKVDSQTCSVTVNSGNPLAGSCSPNPTTTNTGQSVIWTAYPTGGSGNYTYTWSGTEGLTGSTVSVDQTYSTAGTKYATVEIDDGTGDIAVVDCTNATINQSSVTLNPTCSGSPAQTVVGSTASWSATAPTNGVGPYTYSWSNHSEVNGETGQNITSNAYGSSGTKTAIVTVTDSASPTPNTGTAQCAITAYNPVSLGGSCTVTPSDPDTNTATTWTANRSGGIGPFNYSWTGDVTGTNNPMENIIFGTAGTYSATVTVTDTGTTPNGTASANCSVDVSNCVGCSGGPDPITTYEIIPSIVPKNQQCVLTWTTNGADTVVLTNIAGDPLSTEKQMTTGLSVDPSDSYSLTANAPGGSQTLVRTCNLVPDVTEF